MRENTFAMWETTESEWIKKKERENAGEEEEVG